MDIYYITHFTSYRLQVTVWQLNTSSTPASNLAGTGRGGGGANPMSFLLKRRADRAEVLWGSWGIPAQLLAKKNDRTRSGPGPEKWPFSPFS